MPYFILGRGILTEGIENFLRNAQIFFERIWWKNEVKKWKNDEILKKIRKKNNEWTTNCIKFCIKNFFYENYENYIKKFFFF